MTLRIISFLLSILLITSCTKDKGQVDNGSNYPETVASVLLRNCAVQGCHNNQSKKAAGGLSLDTWEELFEGSGNGAVVIPYRPDFSTLCYYTNTKTERGPSLSPLMPLNKNPISDREYEEIRNWILTGAPNANGNIKFDNATGKFYVTNQLCDVVTVIDETTKLPARYIDVGISGKTEFPVCLKVAPDKKNWYVTFLASPILQKFTTDGNVNEGYVDLGDGVWSSFSISSDCRYAYCISTTKIGKITKVDLTDMTVAESFTDPLLIYPKCLKIDNKRNKLYIGSESESYLTIVNLGTNISEKISLGTGVPVTIAVHDGSEHFFVGCAGTDDVKLIDADRDSLVASVTINARPTNIEYLQTKNKLLVTCFDDSLSFPGNIGSLKIVDLETKQVQKTINSGCQPSGIKINSDQSYAIVVNSNISPKGPRPHHISGCGGRNGYISFVDLNNLETIPLKKYELAVYPFAVDLK